MNNNNNNNLLNKNRVVNVNIIISMILFSSEIKTDYAN